MDPLPIDPHLEAITAAVRERRALVLVAPPGAGKTTRVPPALLGARRDPRGSIVVLEPRRIAARAAAQRIARERGWTLGREVGYHVRYENRTRRDTLIHVVTEGVFIRRLQGNPFLEGVDAVLIDEFHERSLQADLALAFLADIRASAREDLAIGVLSATLDPRPVARFLGGALVIETEGRPYPVAIRHLERPGSLRLEEEVSRAVRAAWDESGGHVLVFLPGTGEIRRAARELERFATSSGALLVPLHGSLGLDEQERALAPTRERKIILATNVAETSLTIEGVDAVVDSGLARILRNDPRHGIDRLEIGRISKRSAAQRAGRAGRLGPGKVFRLWTQAEHAALPDEEAPEVRRIGLEGAVLELRAWGAADPGRFPWYEAPEGAALERAEDLLLALGAIAERHGPLTGTGTSLLALPLHPRLARLVVEAKRRGRLAEGALLAALIAEKDIVHRPFTPDARGAERGAEPRAAPAPSHARRGARESGPSDLLVRLDLFEEAERLGFRREPLRAIGVDAAAARAVARARDDVLRAARGLAGAADAAGAGRMRGAEGARTAGRGPAGPRAEGGGSGRDEDLLRILLAAFPDRVARRRAPGSPRGRMTGGRGVALDPESVVDEGDLFLAVELDENVRGQRLEARVRLASRIERSWLEADFPASVREVIDTRFDPKTEKVRATATRSYRDLPLEEPRERPAPPALAAELLAEAAAPRAEEIFLADDAARVLLARLRFLAEHLPELELVPLGAKELAEVIAGACAGRTSLAELRGADLAGLIEARLTHPARAALAREAPESIRVPSGSHIRLHWEPGKPPVLAARLQELFGWKETPRVARGRVPVLLHILGPNHRPVQVTQDLASFWSTTYAEVRKDLRGRYPKHSWPEDPWSAEPERRPRRKGETKTKAKDPAETEGPRKAGARGKTKRKRPG